jgi:hypothetical protein
VFIPLGLSDYSVNSNVYMVHIKESVHGMYALIIVYMAMYTFKNVYMTMYTFINVYTPMYTSFKVYIHQLVYMPSCMPCTHLLMCT